MNIASNLWRIVLAILSIILLLGSLYHNLIGETQQAIYYLLLVWFVDWSNKE